MLRQYISWVQELQPVMTSQAEGILSRYYQMQRQSSCRDAARTTVRMFESLIRIAQVQDCNVENYEAYSFVQYLLMRIALCKA